MMLLVSPVLNTRVNVAKLTMAMTMPRAATPILIKKQRGMFIVISNRSFDTTLAEWQKMSRGYFTKDCASYMARNHFGAFRPESQTESDNKYNQVVPCQRPPFSFLR